MFKSTNIKHASQKRTLIRIAIAAFIMALVSVPGLMTNGNAETNISCGYDSICKSIENNEFDLILYSSFGSEMVILYSGDKIGDVILKVPEWSYTRAKGTVKDAIYFHSRHTAYSGFKFKRARKSTGFFKSEVIDGLYVVIPKYRLDSQHRPPEYSFSEKDGKLKVHIRPVIIESNN